MEILSHYIQAFNNYFTQPEIQNQIQQAVEIIQQSDKVFFIGNGGSNAITSHMMEDYAKVGRMQSYSFTDPALITCFSNDYGYENAMKEWLKLYFSPQDILIAISSSGNSMNIVNAANYAKEKGGKVITLSAFSPDNKLKQIGDINFHIPEHNYGIAECYHQVITHVILDEICRRKQL